MSDREIVVVTGFGPFRQFLVNPSWITAQGLKLAGMGQRIDVYIKELPVSYSSTQRIIAELWQTLKPKFAVHLGIARGSSLVILEQTGGPEKLDSVVNMRAISKHFKQAGIDVIHSRDAGRYLCDFAYYCSLYHGERRAAFIHIPSSGSLSSAERLVPLLQEIIVMMLDQLEEAKYHSET
ncbi:pyroglutamyl-peptidase 1 isoform X2 [Gambusia affinis]|uniref:pyroglutamyl-peptidase 1 isoform X2 n=1 Tax=Gambusia affinis TaxID=33528 RepID=UPI001CDC3B0D|nr:pyroglutamyl-peptidase 1 isoform X2 [Gambusia affinis]